MEEDDNNYKMFVRMGYKMAPAEESVDPIGDIQEILDSGYDINYVVPLDCKVKEWQGCTLLHLVAGGMHGRYLYAAVNLLLNYGSSIMCQNQNSQTPVHTLFQRTNIFDQYLKDVWGAVNRLLTAQVESKDAANPYSEDGISHFHIACACNNSEAVEFFLKTGVFVNIAISRESRLLPGYTPLHIACRNKGKIIIKLLLEHGGDLSSLNAYGITPLQLFFHNDLKKNLIIKTSDYFKSKPIKNIDILNIFCVDNLIVSNCIELNQLQIECIRKQDANELDDLSKFLSHSNVIGHVKFDSPVWAGYTALHFAAQNNMEQVILLLKNGADLLAKDANGITPLDLCCRKYEPSCIGSILKMRNYVDCIKFNDGSNLSDTLVLFDKKIKLKNYLKITNNVNDYVPFDSPLWPGYSILHLAVLLSQKDQVELCLQYGASYTMKDANNMTALHLAFKLNRMECVNEILKAHGRTVSENPVDDNNLSHFHIACMTGNASAVKKFLHCGVDPNVPTRIPYNFYNKDWILTKKIPIGSTAFHIAAAVESEDLIKLLVESKADPNLCDAEGFTWVHRIFFSEADYLCTYLWKHPESLKSNPVAPGGLSHLHIACCASDLNAIKALLPLKTTNVNEPITSEILKFVKPEFSGFHGYFEFTYSRESLIGTTSLHLAIRNYDCSEEIVDLLLKNGADVTAKNSKGHNPVYVCCIMQQNSETVHNLFKRFFKRLILEYKNKGGSYQGITALHFACAMNDITFIKQILEEEEDFNSQIDPDSEIWPGRTPLSILIQYDYPRHPRKCEAVELLLGKFLEQYENSKNKKKAKRRKVSSKPIQNLIINNNGLTVLHVCCIGSDPVIVEKFILAGVDINAQVNLTTPADKCGDNSKAGYTALHYAVEYGSDSVLETLLKYGADFNIEDFQGRTPVHLAAEVSFDKVRIFVRMHKININMRNTLGHTLLDSVLKNGEMLVENCTSLLKLNFAYHVDVHTKLFAYIRSWARNLSLPEFEMLIEYMPKLGSHLLTVDSSNRNVIHHLVSTKLYLDNYSHITNDSFLKDFTNNIEVLLKKGCDLDHQDINGKTPLHLAVHSKQANTVKALLNNGADVNIADNNGMTPYLYCYQDDHWDSYDEFESQSSSSLHEIIKESFDVYVDYVQAAGLHLSERNKLCYQNNFESTCNHTDELYKMAHININRYCSVRTHLTEDLITDFHSMPFTEQHEILKSLESNVLYEEFPNWSPFFKWQRRRILKSIKSFLPTLNE